MSYHAHIDTLGVDWRELVRGCGRVHGLLPAIMTLASTVALGACSPGGLRPQTTALQPAMPRAAQTLGNVALSPAAWPRSDRWSLFGDPHLDRLDGGARADSPTLRTAGPRIRTA